VAILTDGNEVLDVRGITADELGWLNVVAQEVTEGELWWEVMEAGCGEKENRAGLSPAS
jgi:hypothetical protein